MTGRFRCETGIAAEGPVELSLTGELDIETAGGNLSFLDDIEQLRGEEMG